MPELISPRRDEPIVGGDGLPTRRFFEYLEGNSTQVNETLTDTEIDAVSINLTVGPINQLSQRLNNLENLIGIQTQSSDLKQRIEFLECLVLTPVTGQLNALQQQIDELRTLIT